MMSKITAVLAILASGMACAAQTVAASPAGRISALADEFYLARAHYDPLNYATANGDSRFDDQIGMSISPQVRAEEMLSATPEANIFFTPIKNLPQTFSREDKEQLRAAYREVIATRLLPALLRLNHFLAEEYLPAGRSTAGLDALPNGAAWYLARIKNSTGLPLGPDAVHQLGLSEVARIQGKLAELGPKLGYSGPANKMSQWMAEQKQFKPFTTDTQVLEAYRKIYEQVSEQLPRYFHILPKAKLSLQLEPALTRATASDHYTPLAADGSHPGVFWPVVNDPTNYSTVGMVTIFLHEGVPGHHLHAALLKELNLPDFRKFNTENLDTAAYTEGWALYCETLGKEFGFYEHPDAYFGHLNYELLRAVRLVVDTGMHAKGWSRERAIAFTVDTLGYSQAAAKNQIERYMATPAQALAYKIGAMKILELRERARQALGGKFSYGGFHDVVVADGTLPLPILEARVDAWIAREK